jgi:hypothetical protein
MRSACAQIGKVHRMHMHSEVANTNKPCKGVDLQLVALFKHQQPQRGKAGEIFVWVGALLHRHALELFLYAALLGESARANAVTNFHTAESLQRGAAFCELGQYSKELEAMAPSERELSQLRGRGLERVDEYFGLDQQSRQRQDGNVTADVSTILACRRALVQLCYCITT